ncbi:MAG: hypothetical protein A3H02_01175 [Candidatus Niyogibacteria bacterium RIFCSPLOWO2_12_FULL_41_13]|uniref:Uncharacterized protein n=1 Tax=Candidatus Niyogibacteria bacterium RIFCSPLOWO2_12_FULL_41_13 TaxID=1801726 RepID=A0A1G2F4V5_9BACT|nr:MAG: hypothetical protein A3H02_01175 [Candidatus Niyogibacteria bacterium RIFCSPLOWO2_12_FULL_41_13]
MGNRSDLIDEFLKALESAPDFYNTLGGWMQGTADLSGPEESEEFKKALGCFFRSSVILLGVLYRGNGKKFPKVSRTNFEAALDFLEKNNEGGLREYLIKTTEGEVRDEWLKLFEESTLDLGSKIVAGFGRAMLFVAAKAFIDAAEKELEADKQKVLQEARSIIDNNK